MTHATEDQIAEIYNTSTSEPELNRRLREAKVPMQLDGMPLDADGQVDTEAPLYNASGQPENAAAWDAYRAEHPEYAALEVADGPYEVHDAGSVRE